MTAPAHSPSLAVIVAAREARPMLRQCLAALTAQASGHLAELILADGSGNSAVEGLLREFPSVRHLKLSPTANVPKLWRAGIQASGAEIVALTIEQCVPRADWVPRVIQAHSSPWPAIGGAIDAAPSLRTEDWAVYFCRYSGYIPPVQEESLNDLAGDNCSYKRSALQGLNKALADGFWETFVHAELKHQGGQLHLEPTICVDYQGGIHWRSFVKGRFQEGRYFAARRAQNFRRTQRIQRAVMAPAIPVLMFHRIVRRVWRNQRFRGKLVPALPLLILFLTAWAAGEFAGYVFGPSATAFRSPDNAEIRERSA